MKVFLALVFILTVSGCSYLEAAKNSTAGQKFCEWAPVAVVGIEQAALEADKDPAKLKVANAMKEAAGYFRLITSQCP